MTNSKVKIRPLRDEDYTQWLPLWQEYNLFYKRNVSLEITQVTWTRFLNPDEPVFAIVAEVDGELVGFVHYLFHRHTALLEYVCYLQDLFTLNRERGKGIGRGLIDAAYEKAKERGSANIYWLTQDTNTTARILYDKVAKNTGFIVYKKSF